MTFVIHLTAMKTFWVLVESEHAKLALINSFSLTSITVERCQFLNLACLKSLWIWHTRILQERTFIFSNLQCFQHIFSLGKYGHVIPLVVRCPFHTLEDRVCFQTTACGFCLDRVALGQVCVLAPWIFAIILPAVLHTHLSSGVGTIVPL
jgi:hypothetical protein